MNQSALIADAELAEPARAAIGLPRRADFWELEALVTGGVPLNDALASMASARLMREGCVMPPSCIDMREG